jgi:hypothetical protein
VTVDTAISKPHQGSIEIVSTDRGGGLNCFIYDKSLIKRLLKVCPEGSECVLNFDALTGYRDTHYHGVGPVREITKWPARGAERMKP